MLKNPNGAFKHTLISRGLIYGAHATARLRLITYIMLSRSQLVICYFVLFTTYFLYNDTPLAYDHYSLFTSKFIYLCFVIFVLFFVTTYYIFYFCLFTTIIIFLQLNIIYYLLLFSLILF